MKRWFVLHKRRSLNSNHLQVWAIRNISHSHQQTLRSIKWPISWRKENFWDIKYDHRTVYSRRCVPFLVGNISFGRCSRHWNLESIWPIFPFLVDHMQMSQQFQTFIKYVSIHFFYCFSIKFNKHVLDSFFELFNGHCKIHTHLCQC